MENSRIHTIPHNIRHDPTIARVLERMPKEVQQRFDDEQLLHLRNAIGARNWGNHSVDCRGVLSFPLLTSRFYYVFLIGRNRRELSEKEQKIAAWIGLCWMVGLTTSAILFVLLCLYLIKSAMGIDIFPHFSLGIWGWFKANILH